MKEQFTFVINPFDGHGTNFLGGISDHLELRRVFKLMKIILFSRPIKIVDIIPPTQLGSMKSISLKTCISKNAVLRGMYETHFAGGDLYKESFILISHWPRPKIVLIDWPES